MLRRMSLTAATLMGLASLLAVSALAQTSFGPETLARTSGSKDNFSRSFALSDPAAPYTLTVVNGEPDGSKRVRKGWLMLNGQSILTPRVFNKGFPRLVVAIHPAQQNEIKVKLKGGDRGSFVRITVEQTTASILRDPRDAAVDVNQTGVGTPFSIAVDQVKHRAYISDRFWDAIIEFDVADGTVTRWFNGVDGDQAQGNGATTGVCLNAKTETIVAVNEGGPPDSQGSIAVVPLTGGATRVTPLVYGGRAVNALFVALNPDTNVAAFNGLYNSGGRAYFLDLTSNTLVGRDEGLGLTAPVFNYATNQFIFSAKSDSTRPALYSYSGVAPFQRVRRIDSTAPVGTEFERLALNHLTNVLVAVNPRDSAVYLFDLAAGTELARIPFAAGAVPYLNSDLAINPQTNMAAVISGFLERVTIIDLDTQLVAAEIPLPKGTRPLGIGIDHSLNRAVIAENGFASNRRNGTILVMQLPSR